MNDIASLAREVASVGKALKDLSEQDWATPTRCPPMNVKELVAHMLRGSTRIMEMIDAPPIDDEPEKDAVTYSQYDGRAEAAAIVERAQEGARGFETTKDLIKAWDTAWIKALQGARGIRAADPVVPSVMGTMHLSEYIKTRIVEVTIHHLDLDDAVGHAPHPDAGALEAACDVLRGLLGTDLRPLGMDDLRFAVVGTGRAELSDEERSYLGPLVAKFPLLS